MSNQIFQTLKELPTPLFQVQCVLHKHELLICGGFGERACYSYDTLKSEYKLICEYPSEVELAGHCVVKLMDNNKDIDQVTLLSFGGYPKHTLVMKYVSVWSNTLDISNKSNQFNNYNQWVPFTDNHNHPIIIGRDQDKYLGVRAVIGGSNNSLLFITYSGNISVFDLNTFQFIKHDTLLTSDYIDYHCFVANSENGQDMMKINKQNYQMLLFCRNTGLSIEYDEDNNTFQFHQIPVCKDITPFFCYAYVDINDIILFFGGWNNRYGTNAAISKAVHKYSIRENKWITFQNTLNSPLHYCVAILSKDNNIHIIGGVDDKENIISTHIKTKVREWDLSQLVMICLFIFIYFDENK
ncbi:hypothetical protein RFI_00278 [Reticulomyxa filosa]|uniref:Kelch motif family protein n=1 Tax=Reticulomyxa filosa TaxID=46433 RepID=X6PFE1_RETFI|nr:hypothetical protein RFI_00278 [Reticulomyxa filosa]|eukprot:ETO36784.1 hypothetical protein RFI_00278 [Reticulomyxa filosa]